MPARKDKKTQPHRYLSVRLPVSVVDALSRMADAKRTTRNALITQTLKRIAKKHIEEAQG
jgi:hypothetical protein